MLRPRAAIILLLAVFAGCRTWKEPCPRSWWSGCAHGDASLENAQTLARQATRAERACSAESVDLHYQAALASWTLLTSSTPATPSNDLAWDIYNTSVARFLATSRDYGRHVPGRGITVVANGQQWNVPLVMHDLPWRPDDVQSMHPVGKYRAPSISRQYRCAGWGVPLVVQRHQGTGAYREEPFLAPGAVFAATALLRPDGSGHGAVLELFNPLRPATASLAGVAPLATDISAPFAFREVTSPELVSGWIPFIGSDMPIREGLFFIEPYQPGKVPIVMVHGLLSSPISWVDLANDLRAIPGFADHFQLWAFRYATGKPFLGAAARLRRDIGHAVAAVDPGGMDPALQNIVLAGHSMGGLVCQLQASYSEERLWSAVANRPVEAIVTTEQTRAELVELFFFDPQPNVRRVIQLATPHEGSSWANRPIGYLGDALVRSDSSQTARHEQLRADNPGVFSPELERRVPTSIDMLNPNSTVLQAIDGLRTSPCVRFHTVYGYGRFNFCEGQGDGIVSIQSATSFPAVSQVGVRASHTTVHRKLETVEEVARILQQHLNEMQLHSDGTPLVGNAEPGESLPQNKFGDHRRR